MRVLVTRAAEDASSLAQALVAAGFEPVRVPLSTRLWEVDAVIEAARAHPQVDWLVVTSAVTAEILAAGAPEAWSDARIAAVGPATARRLAAIGRPAHLVPSKHTGLQLAAELPDIEGCTILYPRADLAPSTLPDALRSRGALVVEVVAYRNVEPPGCENALLDALPVDATAVLSGSVARRLVRHIPEARRSELGKIVVIGPTTAADTTQAGLPIHGVAEPHTLNGVIEALEGLRTA